MKWTSVKWRRHPWSVDDSSGVKGFTTSPFSKPVHQHWPPRQLPPHRPARPSARPPWSSLCPRPLRVGRTCPRGTTPWGRFGTQRVSSPGGHTWLWGVSPQTPPWPTEMKASLPGTTWHLVNSSGLYEVKTTFVNLTLKLPGGGGKWPYL